MGWSFGGPPTIVIAKGFFYIQRINFYPLGSNITAPFFENECSKRKKGRKGEKEEEGGEEERTGAAAVTS